VDGKKGGEWVRESAEGRGRGECEDEDDSAKDGKVRAETASNM
jgi:hypothetical protein